MFNLLKKIINSSNGRIQVADTDLINVHLALTVLLEAAHADGECSNAEIKHLIDRLVTHFGVSRQEVDALLADRNKEPREYVDLFQYTRFINNNFSERQKIDIMESVWCILTHCPVIHICAYAV